MGSKESLRRKVVVTESVVFTLPGRDNGAWAGSPESSTPWSQLSNIRHCLYLTSGLFWEWEKGRKLYFFCCRCIKCFWTQGCLDYKNKLWIFKLNIQKLKIGLKSPPLMFCALLESCVPYYQVKCVPSLSSWAMQREVFYFSKSAHVPHGQFRSNHHWLHNELWSNSFPEEAWRRGERQPHQNVKWERWEFLIPRESWLRRKRKREGKRRKRKKKITIWRK